jgi:hypothetical protein
MQSNLLQPEFLLLLMILLPPPLTCYLPSTLSLPILLLLLLVKIPNLIFYVLIQPTHITTF